MKHWKTNEEMGSGYAHTKKEHQYLQYNSLIKMYKHEQNLMRTFYLIKDCWSLEQLEELKEFIDEQIKERKESFGVIDE